MSNLQRPDQKSLRQGRYSETDLFYFITTVVKDREPLFLQPLPAQIVLDALKWLDQHNRIALVVAVAMPDHLHFIAQLKNTILSKLMHSLKSYTANEINKALGRTGQVWERQYYERGIRDEESLINLAKYCLDNPVRKELVDDFRKYPYWYCIYGMQSRQVCPEPAEEKLLPGRDIIVVGASAGGIEALKEIVRGLSKGLPAAVFVVIHIPAEGTSILPNILSKAGSLPALHPVDGEEIQHGRIYVAPNNHHLLLIRGYIHLVRGPKENNVWPAIDPLFRTAARAYGPRVVGVVLTGSLDDGAAGLLVVKKRGGIAVVQDPDSVLFSEMPRSALEYVDVDYCLPLSDIPPLITTLARKPVNKEAGPVSKEVEVESKIAEFDMATIENDEEKLGTLSVFSCPDCQGTLWELRDGDLTQFRCRVGHAFSIESMHAKQAEMLETALRALEERANLERRLADQARQRNHKITADRFGEKVEMAEHHAAQIRQILLNNKQSE